MMAYYQKNGFGFLVVTLNNPAETPVGICGFIKRDYLDCPDFGFAFLPQFMGQGYAYEISVALLPYAKNVLQIEKLCAITTLDNTRSIKLLEKLGFHFDKIITEEDGEGEKEELRLFLHDSISAKHCV
jgi:RimJ/RimL family protein N-acetyltransferase